MCHSPAGGRPTAPPALMTRDADIISQLFRGTFLPAQLLPRPHSPALGQAPPPRGLLTVHFKPLPSCYRVLTLVNPCNGKDLATRCYPPPQSSTPAGMLHLVPRTSRTRPGKSGIIRDNPGKSRVNFLEKLPNASSLLSHFPQPRKDSV